MSESRFVHTPESARNAGLIVEENHDCADCEREDAPCVITTRGGWTESVCLECWGDQKYDDQKEDDNE